MAEEGCGAGYGPRMSRCRRGQGRRSCMGGVQIQGGTPKLLYKRMASRDVSRRVPAT